MSPRDSFLEAVLGQDGATALSKAAERSEELEGALLPRTILSWINFAALAGHEGPLPGVEGSQLAFSKSGTGYTGTISIGEGEYRFQDAGLYHLASAVAVALGVPPEPISDRLRGPDMVRLGQNIDLLARARLAQSELAKIEPRGPAAAPLAPEKAAQPTMNQRPPAAPKAKLPRKSKNPMLKVAKSEASHRCGTCSGTMFSGNRFTGCICFKSMAKSVKTEEQAGRLVLSFGDDWDRASIVSLAEELNNAR